jgi:hypothetical protein
MLCRQHTAVALYLFTYLFIYLFLVYTRMLAEYVLTYVALNDRMTIMSWKWHGQNWLWPNLGYSPGFCLEGLRKSMLTLLHTKFKSTNRVGLRSIIVQASPHGLYYVMSFSVPCSVSCMISLFSTPWGIRFSNLACTSRLEYFDVTHVLHLLCVL